MSVLLQTPPHVSWAPAEHPDAALLALCATYHQWEAARQAADGDAADAARDREWEYFDLIAAAPSALTEAGRAAKARVALAMTTRNLSPNAPPDGVGELDDDEVFARRVLAEVGGVTLTSRLVAPPCLAADCPDAELIQACAQHAVNMDNFNGSDDIKTFDDMNASPLWAAYSETRDLISAAKPQTMAGVIAKARVAQHEATDQHSEQSWKGSMGELWAFDIVNDLVRLAGPG